MSRTANSARIAGVSMDKLLGYLAVVQETTQKDASSIGNSFNTIFARFGQIKAGKFIDEETGESLSDVSKVLGKFGIQLYDTAGNMANVGDILDNLASRWKTFTDVEKNALATTIAGTRQRENLLALMENYNKALEYNTIASESAGTAEQKFSAYLEGIEALTQQLNASFEKLSQTVIDSNLVKDVIKMLTDFVDKVQSFSESGLADFSVEFIKWFAIIKLGLPSLNKLVTSVGGLGAKFTMLKNVLFNQSTYIQQETQKLIALGTEAKKAGEMAQQSASMMRFNIIASAVAVSIAAINTHLNRINERKVQRLTDEIERTSKELEEIKNKSATLTNIINQYETIGKTTLQTEESQTQLNELQDDLNEILKNTNKQVDLLHGNYEEVLNTLRNINREQNGDVYDKQLEAAEALESKFFADNSRNVFMLGKTAFEGLGATLTRTGVYANLYDKYITPIFDKIITRTSKEYSEGIFSMGLPKAGAEYLAIEQAIANGTKNVSNAYNLGKEAIDLFDYALQNNIITQEEYEEALKEANYAMKDFQADYDAIYEAYKDPATTELKEAFEDGVIKTKEELDEYLRTVDEDTTKSEIHRRVLYNLAVDSYNKYIKSLQEAEKALQKQITLQGLLADKLDELKNRLGDIRNIYSTLTESINEYNEKNYISTKNYTELLKLSPQYLRYLFDENGQIKDNTKSLKEWVAVQSTVEAVTAAQSYLDSLQGLKSEQIIALSKEKTVSYQREASALWENIRAQVYQMNITKEAKDAVWNVMLEYYQLNIANIKELTDNTEELTKKVKAYFDFATKYYDDEIEKLQKLNEALQDQQEQYDLAVAYINRYIDERIDALNREKDALNAKNDEAERETKLQELQLKLAKAQQKNMRVYVKGQGWVWTYDDSANQEAQKDLRKLSTESQLEAIDKLIQAWQDYKTAWENGGKLFDKEREKAAFDALQLAKIGDLAKRDTKPIKEYAINYRDLKKEIADNEEAIKGFEELKDELSDMAEEYENSEKDMSLTLEEQTTIRQMLLDNDLESFRTYVDNYIAEEKRLAEIPVVGGIGFKGANADPLGRAEREAKSLASASEDVIGHLTDEEEEELYKEPFWGYEISSYKDFFKQHGIGFASGTKSSPQGIANVDENGNELIIDPPSRGRYTFLRDGSGVLPHNLTERIFDMASNPARFVNNALNKNSLLTNKSSTNTVLNISNVSLPSVKNGNDFVKELQVIANNR